MGGVGEKYCWLCVQQRSLIIRSESLGERASNQKNKYNKNSDKKAYFAVFYDWLQAATKFVHNHDH